MAEGVLFNPDNRSLSTSTGDLGLYGGQADPSVDVHALRDDVAAAATQSFAALTPGAAQATNNGAIEPHSFIGDTQFGESAGATSLTPVAFTLAPVTSFHSAASPLPAETLAPGNVSIFVPAVPAAIGLGALAPQPTAPQPDAPVHETVAPGVAAADAVVEPVIAALGNVGGVTAPVLDEITQTAEALVTTTVQTVADLGANAVDGLTDTLDVTVAPVLDAVGDTVAAAATITAPLLDAVAQVTHPTGDLVTTTVDSAGDAAGAALGGVAEPVSALLGSGGEAVTATVGAAGDSLAGLAGADPEGGIATLVSLVSAADMFDLQPTNAPSAETTDSELGFDLLDTLADADTGLGALLGGDHHHDDAGGLFGGHGDPAHPLGL